MMDPELLKKAIDFYDCTQSWHTSTRWGGYSLLEFLDLLEADKIIIAGGTEEEKIGRIQERCIRPALEKCELLADHYIQAMEALEDNIEDNKDRIGFRRALLRYNSLTARIYRFYEDKILSFKEELEEIQYLARQIVVDDAYIEMLKSEELKDISDRKLIEQILYSYTHIVDPYEKHLSNCYWYFELIAQDQTYAFFEGYILKKLKTEEIDGIPKEARSDVKRYSIIGGTLRTFEEEEGRMPNAGRNRQGKITVDKGDAKKLVTIIRRVQEAKEKPASHKSKYVNYKPKTSTWLLIGSTEQDIKRMKFTEKLPKKTEKGEDVLVTNVQNISLSNLKKRDIKLEFAMAHKIGEDGDIKLVPVLGNHALTGGEIALIRALCCLIRDKIGEDYIGRYGELKKYPIGEKIPENVSTFDGGRNLFSRNEILNALYCNKGIYHTQDYNELSNTLVMLSFRSEHLSIDEEGLRNLSREKREKYEKILGNANAARPIISYEERILPKGKFYTFDHLPYFTRVSEMMGHRVKVPSELLQLPIQLDEKRIEGRIKTLDSMIEQIKDIEGFESDGRYIEYSEERSRLSNQLRIMRVIGNPAKLWDEGGHTMSVPQSMNNAGILNDVSTQLYRDDRLNKGVCIIDLGHTEESILQNYDAKRWTREELIRNTGIVLCHYAGIRCMNISDVEYIRGSRGISYRVHCAPLMLSSNNKLTRQKHLDECYKRKGTKNEPRKKSKN